MRTRNKNIYIRRTMKKLAVGIAIILGFTLLQPINAQAANESIVIIDTGIDSTRKEFTGKIVYEVCTLEAGTCPNGKTFQEGIGSATLPVDKAYRNGFEHGTIMTLIANKVNPNINIVFIRIAGMNPTTGAMYSFSDYSLTQAMNWVVANRTKFNIISVSASMGSHNLLSGTNYCPIRSTHKQLISNIDTLISNGVPTMFPSGNGRDRTRIDFPACIPQAVAIGGTNPYNVGEIPTLSIFFNTGPDVDFYALGTFMTPIKNAVGTSGATVAMSAYWAKNYKGSYKTTYDYLKSISKSTSNQYITTNSFVDILN